MIRVDGFNESYKGRLVGMDRGHYLIFTTPRIRGIWMKVGKDNHIVVRYLHKGIVYGFKCGIISLIEEPPLMVLSYPEDNRGSGAEKSGEDNMPDSCHNASGWPVTRRGNM